MRWTCLVFSLVCPAVCLAADGADAGAPSTSADPALAAIDAVWRERGDPAKAEEGIHLAQAALAAKPDDYERALARPAAELLGRRRRWSQRRPEAEGSASEVWDARRPDGEGEARVGRGPLLRRGGHRRLLARRSASSRRSARGWRRKFNERLDKAIEIDPQLRERRCRCIAKGRYYFELPWPKRDLGKSAELVPEGAREANPNNLRAPALPGRDAAGGRRRRRRRRRQLAKVPQGTIAYDPAEGGAGEGHVPRRSQAQIEEERKMRAESQVASPAGERRTWSHLLQERAQRTPSRARRRTRRTASGRTSTGRRSSRRCGTSRRRWSPGASSPATGWPSSPTPRCSGCVVRPGDLRGARDHRARSTPRTRRTRCRYILKNSEAVLLFVDNDDGGRQAGRPRSRACAPDARRLPRGEAGGRSSRARRTGDREVSLAELLARGRAADQRPTRRVRGAGRRDPSRTTPAASSTPRAPPATRRA